jgi:hypothetical protein
MFVPRAGAKPRPFPPPHNSLFKHKYYMRHMNFKSHPWARRLARSCQPIARRIGRGFDPGKPLKFYIKPQTNHRVPRGTSTPNHKVPSVKCWFIHQSTMCQMSYATSPAQLAADVIPCHVSPIDWSNCLSYATSSYHVSYLGISMCHLQGFPCHLYGRMACIVRMPRGTVRTV